jgi:hypothetical protein
VTVSRADLSRLERLEASLSPDGPKLLDVNAACFPKQLAFVKDPSRFRTGCTSRRAGKTNGAAMALVNACQARPGVVGLYITKTRINAKRILWSTLHQLNREQKLGAQLKEAELCMELPNGSIIYLAGANNRDEIEKFRGLPLATVVIDEAQALPAYLQELVDEVLAPALMDWNGTLVAIGTPAPVPVGYFYDCTRSAGWGHHEWTVFDNPHIERKSGKRPQQHLEEELSRRGVTVDEPSIQREWFGRWVYDENALVFRYTADRNDYDSLPTIRGTWNKVICGDIGFDDADALGVLAWCDELPSLYLIHEDVMPKQTITQLGDKLKALESAHNPLAIVLDFGGLGKKIAEELTARWGLNVEAAEKERKHEHIELLNDAMRSGRLFAKKGSQFAQDCMLVEWDKTNPEKWKISERFHSDVCDAVLYGYRKALHWLHTPAPPPKAKPGTDEWAAAQVAEMEEQAEEEVRRQRADRMDDEESTQWL